MKLKAPPSPTLARKTAPSQADGNASASRWYSFPSSSKQTATPFSKRSIDKTIVSSIATPFTYIVNIINVIFYSLVIVCVGLLISRLTRYVVTFEPIGKAIIWILSGICLFSLFGVVISIISFIKMKKEFAEDK